MPNYRVSLNIEYVLGILSLATVHIMTGVSQLPTSVLDV